MQRQRRERRTGLTGMDGEARVHEAGNAVRGGRSVQGGRHEATRTGVMRDDP